MAVGDITTIRLETDFGFVGAISNFAYVATTSNPTWEGRIVDVWIADVLPFYMAMLSPECVVSQIEIHPILPVGGHTVFRSVVPNQVGSLGTDATAGQVAAKVTWYPDGSHRSQRGRTYIGGIANDQIVGHRITSDDFDTLARAWASTMLAKWGEGGDEATARFGILSRFLDGAERASPVVLPVVRFDLPRILGTQRRRLW